MTIKKTFVITCLFIILLLFYLSSFIVVEGHRALILRFGKIVLNPNSQKTKVYEPGFHLKMPFINIVKSFDIRLQTLDVQSSRILTAEQKYVLVDYYVKWRINNLSLYFTRTSGNSQLAENLLEQKINDALRAEFGTHSIKEVISDEREKIMTVLRQKANESAKNLGAAIVDVRIKSIDLPKEVSQSVFARMRADRERVAARHRADGKGQADVVQAKADAEVVVTLASARAQAAKIRAKGARQAAATYARVYGQNPAFYNFYRSISAYQKVFNNKQSILVLKPDSQFFKYFNHMKH